MQRSKTSSKNSLCLPGSNGQPAAIFDFAGDAYSFRITVPSGSNWQYWYHWQSPNSSLCDKVRCIDGSIVIIVDSPPQLRGFTQFGGRGREISFDPHTMSSWFLDSTRRRGDDLVVDLTGDESFHRNVCSAIIDRDSIAFLTSTPVLLRYLLSLLALYAPSIREWILDVLLAIQLRMIFYAYGFWILHWTIPFLWWWHMRQIWGRPRPPPWAYKLDWQFRKYITYSVQAMCFWVGKLLLGMKDRYPEYTPEPRRDSYGPLSGNGIQRNMPLVRAKEV
ncbi:hypothetical protein FQN57_002095 [Myotisia sp. PD_48]|nr:hypothetical protein FQN57_002095 [Myotisia sp. PD_48]